MVRIQIKPHPTKRKVEIIDLHEKEVPLFINKLYSTVNKPDNCMGCRHRKAEFIRIVIENFTKVKMLKLCKVCLGRFV